MKRKIDFVKIVDDLDAPRHVKPPSIYREFDPKERSTYRHLVWTFIPYIPVLVGNPYSSEVLRGVKVSFTCYDISDPWTFGIGVSGCSLLDAWDDELGLIIATGKAKSVLEGWTIDNTPPAESYISTPRPDRDITWQTASFVAREFERRVAERKARRKESFEETLSDLHLGITDWARCLGILPCK